MCEKGPGGNQAKSPPPPSTSMRYMSLHVCYIARDHARDPTSGERTPRTPRFHGGIGALPSHLCSSSCAVLGVQLVSSARQLVLRPRSPVSRPFSGQPSKARMWRTDHPSAVTIFSRSKEYLHTPEAASTASKLEV